MNDVVPQPETVAEKTKLSKTRLWSGLALKVTGVLFLFLAFCLLYYGTIAYAAWNSGEQIRRTEIARARREEIDKQFALAQTDVNDGRYELALRRLDWLLAQDASYSGAAALRTEAQNQRNLALTPPTATPSPTPTATPSPTPSLAATASLDTTAADERIAELEDAVVRGRWESAINDLIAFQIDYPSYRRTETDRLLYDAYIGLGLNLLNSSTDEIESGLLYLNRAKQLGDLSEEVEGEIVFGELYLEGIVFYGVNWEAYLYYFRELCTYAPTFHDSCTLLKEGLIAYGDQLAVALDWCPALDHYREATTVAFPVTDELRTKIEDADAACLLATPTPTAVITDTLPITNTFRTIP